MSRDHQQSGGYDDTLACAMVEEAAVAKQGSE